jgi:transcriptional pleiotropic regulator of transition state genes
MKSTGVVRRVDELGRIVIPMELRRTLNIGEKDPLEIFVAEDMIILKKYTPGCIFCGSVENVQQCELLPLTLRLEVGASGFNARLLP